MFLIFLSLHIVNKHVSTSSLTQSITKFLSKYKVLLLPPAFCTCLSAVTTNEGSTTTKN